MMRTSCIGSRGVEPLETRVCLSAGHHDGGAIFLAQSVDCAPMPATGEHHQFTASAHTDVAPAGAMIHEGMVRSDDGKHAGLGHADAQMMMPLPDAFARALEQLARDMIAQLQRGGQVVIIRTDAPSPQIDSADAPAAPASPATPKSGVAVSPQAGASASAEKRAAVMNMVTTPASRVAPVAEAGRAIEILEVASDVITTAPAAATTAGSTGIAERASSAANALWSIAPGGGETTAAPSMGSNVLAAASPTATVAARANGALASLSEVSMPRLFEFAHLGSPMTLLADSMASFIEDSAAIAPIAAAITGARSQTPWLITFSVIAADVVLLTYMHRRRACRADIARSIGVPPMP